MTLENANKINIEILKDKDYVLENLHIGLQGESTDEILKRGTELEGLEAYLYLRYKDDEDGIYTIKLNEKFLNYLKINEEEAWKKAYENNHNEAVIKPIFKVIGDMLGVSFDNDMATEESEFMYVVTNKDMNCGAGLILDKDILTNLSEMCKTNQFAMIPSSRHEVIVVPDAGYIDYETLSEMVRHVNETEVRAEDVLADRAFKIVV